MPACLITEIKFEFIKYRDSNYNATISACRSDFRFYPPRDCTPPTQLHVGHVLKNVNVPRAHMSRLFGFQKKKKKGKTGNLHLRCSKNEVRTLMAKNACVGTGVYMRGVGSLKMA